MIVRWGGTRLEDRFTVQARSGRHLTRGEEKEMKKVLLTLCGTLLLTALLSAPALALVDYITPMVCSVAGRIGPFVPSGETRILRPSGDLYVKLFLPPGTPAECSIRCFGNPVAPAPAPPVNSGAIAVGTADAAGKLVARVPGVPHLPLAPGQQCQTIQITCFDPGEFPNGGWLSPTTALSCVEGF